MSKIRVACFCDVFTEDVDGALRTMFQIFRRIPKNEFEYLFICGNGPKEINGFECYFMTSFNIPRNESYNIVIPRLSKKRTIQRLNDFKPDIIHTSTPSYLGYFAHDYAKNHGNIPIISIFHTHYVSYVKYYFRGFPNFIVRYMTNLAVKIQRNFYNGADLAYIPSETVHNELVETNVDSKRLKYWKRGIDTKLFNSSKRNISFIQEITGNNNKNILFVSRLVVEKNISLLQDIYNYIEEHDLPYNIIIAGDGVARSQTEKSMPKAYFMGNLNHNKLSVLYASSDVFLFTSVTESYGNVIIEAMSSGLPCVVADAGGPKDLIKDGINGFKCPSDDTEKFIEKISLLFSDNVLWNKISEEGINYSHNLNWNEIVSVYFEDLKKLHNDHHNNL